MLKSVAPEIWRIGWMAVIKSRYRRPSLTFFDCFSMFLSPVLMEQIVYVLPFFGGIEKSSECSPICTHILVYINTFFFLPELEIRRLLHGRSCQRNLVKI